MADRTGGVTVVPVTEDNWRTYRDVRLAALLDTPHAFASTYAGNAAREEGSWLARLTSLRVWLAFEGDRPVGLVALSRDDELPEDEAYLIQMWVSASARGRGAGDLLVDAALTGARAAGYSRVLLDVGEENVVAQRLYERTGSPRTESTWTPRSTRDPRGRLALSVDPGCRPVSASGTVEQ